jgi:hypothetical protein
VLPYCIHCTCPSFNRKTAGRENRRQGPPYPDVIGRGRGRGRCANRTWLTSTPTLPERLIVGSRFTYLCGRDFKTPKPCNRRLALHGGLPVHQIRHLYSRSCKNAVGPGLPNFFRDMRIFSNPFGQRCKLTARSMSSWSGNSRNSTRDLFEYMSGRFLCVLLVNLPLMCRISFTDILWFPRFNEELRRAERRPVPLVPPPPKRRRQ